MFRMLNTILTMSSIGVFCAWVTLVTVMLHSHIALVAALLPLLYLMVSAFLVVLVLNVTNVSPLRFLQGFFTLAAVFPLQLVCTLYAEFASSPTGVKEDAQKQISAYRNKQYLGWLFTNFAVLYIFYVLSTVYFDAAVIVLTVLICVPTVMRTPLVVLHKPFQIAQHFRLRSYIKKMSA